MGRVKRNPGTHSGVVRLCLFGAGVGGCVWSARVSEHTHGRVSCEPSETAWRDIVSSEGIIFINMWHAQISRGEPCVM